ncbi:hypothetical protein NIES2130_06690 [Scytonema sp. HK-05]|uniref:hypothetical protein n=1 Tax=Scytonema sp. HK-05 TaxID=1137095 RepID=UPI000936DB84|nr:hypothetical protein [Scytonema sp. HK-05]OKH59849.1 hypothetical protein NIES2130_06690 [Scytonema sp. HK-05]
MKGCTTVCGGTRRGRKTKMLVETVRPALREGFPTAGDWRSRSVPKAYPEGLAGTDFQSSFESKKQELRWKCMANAYTRTSFKNSRAFMPRSTSIKRQYGSVKDCW